MSKAGFSYVGYDFWSTLKIEYGFIIMSPTYFGRHAAFGSTKIVIKTGVLNLFEPCQKSLPNFFSRQKFTTTKPFQNKTLPISFENGVTSV